MTAFVTFSVGFLFRSKQWGENADPATEAPIGNLRRSVDGGPEVRRPDCAGRGG